MKINTPTPAIIDGQGNVFLFAQRELRYEPLTEKASRWDSDDPAEAPHRATQVLITEIAR